MSKAKTDCFAYKPGSQNPHREVECTAPDKLYCKEGKCRFCKAADLIRAQGEQIKRMTAEEYLKRQDRRRGIIHQ